jgi:hypothetical protein
MFSDANRIFAISARKRIEQMRFLRQILTCAVGVGLTAGLPPATVSQTEREGQNPAIQAQPPAPVVSCRCVQKPPPQPGHRPIVHKPLCDYSCDCAPEKTACSLALAQQQAERDAALGKFYFDNNQFEAALGICQEGLKLAGYLESLSGCEEKAIEKLRDERKKELSARLQLVDARLWRGEADEAFAEVSRVRSELAPPQSPLGNFDEAMNAEVSRRLNLAKRMKWAIRGIPIIFWTSLRALAVVLALVVGLYLLRLVVELILRHQRYRTARLGAETIDWTVWSIRDSQDQGGAGPVMDALNPSNNPLLREQLKPSSLLLVPPLAVVDGMEMEDEECPVWKDFLDEPRQAIDMEELPSLEELRRHRFNQMEAFDELDVKFGSIEAKGIVGLFRAIGKWLDRGLPAAQGTVYTLAEGSGAQSYACVRITCNWTTELQALSRQGGEPSPGVHTRGEVQEQDENGPADETISVYASTANDPSIDAVALSAQRAGFKLFHRLVRKSSPSYATAVANFHQGVKLIDEYI